MPEHNRIAARLRLRMAEDRSSLSGINDMHLLIYILHMAGRPTRPVRVWSIIPMFARQHTTSAALPVPPHTRPSNRSYRVPTGRAHVQGPLSRELAAVTERRIPESPLLKTVFRVG